MNATLSFTSGTRLLQKTVGWLTALLFIAGFAALVDGLTAEMMRGPNRVDALPGSSTPLAGPIPVKSAELADVYVHGNAPDGQVRLEIDNFFASYWFGSGMWRGRVVVKDNPGLGEYPMAIEFRDAPPRSIQQYRIVIWADAESMRKGSFARLTRDAGLDPFFTAAVLILSALGGAMLSFFVGQYLQKKLRSQGMSEIYKVLRGRDGTLEVTFGLGAAQGLAVGLPCRVLRPDGIETAHAPIALCEARYASLILPRGSDVHPGYVVIPHTKNTTREQ